MTGERMIDLEAEFAAAQAAMTSAHRDRLHRMGVETWATDARCSLIGTARVRFEGQRFFEFAPDDGDPAVVVAARGDDGPVGPDHEDPIRAAAMGEAIHDLVAFTTTRPDRWATRLGAVDHLGFMPIQAMLSSDPTDGATWFWPHPLAWLAAGCDGVAILTGDPATIRSVVLSARRPYCEDAALAAQLRAIAARPMPVPEFKVMRRTEFFDQTLGITLSARRAA